MGIDINRVDTELSNYQYHFQVKRTEVLCEQSETGWALHPT